MYDTLEEVDEALKKLDKRLTEADELVDRGTWGGLLRGSHKKAGIKEQRDYLLRRREQLVNSGVKINVSTYIDKSMGSLVNLQNIIKKINPEKENRVKEIMNQLEELKKEIED